MTKVVNGTFHEIVKPSAPERGPDGLILQTHAQEVITKFYDDGRVIQQHGRGADWVQVCDPDVLVQAVGKCKDCGKLIYEDEDWDYKENKDGSTAWVRHQTEEDCKK